MISRLNATAVYKVVSEQDPALLWETKEEIEALKASGGDARWTEYLKSFDISKLKFIEGKNPTLFHVKILKNSQKAELNEKHFETDTVAKKTKIKNNLRYLCEIFDLCVQGVTDGEQPLVKVNSEEFPVLVIMSIGATVNMLSEVSPASKN